MKRPSANGDLTIRMNALGKHLRLKEGDDVEIIGVVNDFQHGLMMDDIEPLLFRYDPREIQVCQRKDSTGRL